MSRRAPRVGWGFVLLFGALAVISMALKADDADARRKPDHAAPGRDLAARLIAQGFAVEAPPGEPLQARRGACRMLVQPDPIPDSDRGVRTAHPELPLIRYRYREAWHTRYPRLRVLAGTLLDRAGQRIDPDRAIRLPLLVAGNAACRPEAIDFGPVLLPLLPAG